MLVIPNEFRPYMKGDGTGMMVPESLLAFVDEVKMTGQLENPKRRF
jgi:hypothetical protein